MDDDGATGRSAPRASEWSLALGVAGLACAAVPVVGDWVAGPLGIAAVVLGSIGIHVAERDARPGMRRGLGGAMLGLVTLGAVLFSVAAGLLV